MKYRLASKHAGIIESNSSGEGGKKSVVKFKDAAGNEHSFVVEGQHESERQVVIDVNVETKEFD